MNQAPTYLFNSVSSPAKKNYAFIETMRMVLFVLYFIDQFIAFVTKKPMHDKN